MNNINIETVTNGYIAKIGCQTVVFESREKMLKELDRYLQDPVKVEKEYNKLRKQFLPDGGDGCAG